jgi:hypothetical protein
MICTLRQLLLLQSNGKTGLMGHLACMRKVGNAYKFQVGESEICCGRDHFRNLANGGFL